MILQIPDNIAYALDECITRCGVKKTTQPTKQLESNVVNGPPNVTTTTSTNPSTSSSTTKTNSTTNAISNGNVNGNLDSNNNDNDQNKGLIIGLIIAVGVMGLGYVALALLALFRRRKGGKGTARGYVRAGESFAPGGVYDSEKYELPSEHLRTPYDPPSGSH